MDEDGEDEGLRNEREMRRFGALDLILAVFGYKRMSNNRLWEAIYKKNEETSRLWPFIAVMGRSNGSIFEPVNVIIDYGS